MIGMEDKLKSTSLAQKQSDTALLVIALLGTFVAIMDSSIVFVALPTIQRELGANYMGIQLVTGGYLVAYALFLVMGGRLGDTHGFTKLFQIGMVVFTLASLLAAFAPSIEVLVVARVIQGGGAALFYPQILSTLNSTFEGQHRMRALGLFGAMIGIASIAGQVLGGVLIQANIAGTSWRSIFFINLPIGLIAILGARRYWPSSYHLQRQRLDLLGIVSLAVALLLLLLPLVVGPDTDWPTWTLVSLLVCLPAFWLFVHYERRMEAAEHLPLFAVSLLRHRNFRWGSLLTLFWFMCNGGTWLVLTLELQYGLHASALVAGFTLAAMGIPLALASALAPRVAEKLPWPILPVGLLIQALGLLTLASTVWLMNSTLEPIDLVPGLVIIGLGAGLGLSPLVGLVLEDLPAEHLGSASGTLETTTQVSLTLGTTTLGLLLFEALGGHAVGLQAGHDAFGHAFLLTVVVSLALILAALIVSRLLWERHVS